MKRRDLLIGTAVVAATPAIATDIPAIPEAANGVRHGVYRNAIGTEFFNHSPNGVEIVELTKPWDLATSIYHGYISPPDFTELTSLFNENRELEAYFKGQLFA